MTKKSIQFTELPALGAPLDGGIFVGLTTTKDGMHCAVLLLPEQGSGLTHAKARAWAKKQGGELPSRPVAAMLFANVKDQLRPLWHLCAETNGSGSCAWTFSFLSGCPILTHKSVAWSAVAVRRIPLSV